MHYTICFHCFTKLIYVVEWRMTDRNREGAEWDERKWKKKIDITVKTDGLSEWKNRMDRKETLRWYREKE